MITAVDTNVLLDILSPINPLLRRQASVALRICTAQGDIVISTIVYAELAARFKIQAELDEFLSEASIAVTDISTQAGFLAGTLFAAYLRRGGKRERILPDYLVGAHAIDSADQLLTRDGRFYGSTFPGLSAISPEDLLGEASPTI